MPATPMPPTKEAVAAAAARFQKRNGSLVIPPFDPAPDKLMEAMMHVDTNVQTDIFLETMGLPHVWTRACTPHARMEDPNALNIDVVDDVGAPTVSEDVNEIHLDDTI